MSARDPYAFKLGLFVVSGIVLGLGGIFALGLSTLLEVKLPVNFYFQENVQGLEKGSEIKYRGVQIGRVETVELVTGGDNGSGSGMSRDRKALIRVQAVFYPDRFGQQAEATLKKREDLTDLLIEQRAAGLRVRIAWKDITGQKYLDVDYHAQPDDPIPKLPFQPEEPYLPTAVERGFDDIQRDLATSLANIAKFDFATLSDGLVNLVETLNQRVEDLDTRGLSDEAQATLSSVRKLLDSEELVASVKRLDAITANLETASGRAAEMMARDDIDRMLDDFAATAASMRTLTADLETKMPQLVDSMDGALTEARSALEESQLPETTAALRNASDGVGAASRSIVGMREDLRRTLRDFGAATRSIGRLARLLEEHPQALIGGKGEEVQ